MAKKKKGGFRRGSSKPSGALIGLGAVAIAALAGAGVGEVARSTVGARGVVKHGTAFVVAGPAGAIGSIAADMLMGRGLDVSLSIPSFGNSGAGGFGVTF